MSLTEHSIDYGTLLEMARALDRLQIVPAPAPGEGDGGDASRVRVEVSRSGEGRS